MTRESAEEINQAAGRWAVRVERGLSDSEEAEFQAWVAADPRRRGAFGRMTALLDRTMRAAALGPSFDPHAFEAPIAVRPSRRAWLIGVSAMAASMAAAGVLTVLRSQTYRTSKGGKQVVALDDGSVATLNTATVITVSYSDTQRRIDLQSGEALFDVATDPSRPFIVQAGETEVRATGTSFIVSRLDNAPVEVLVREGSVAVSKPETNGQDAVRVAANSKATVDTKVAAVQVKGVDTATLKRELAWQEGRIVFEGETLAAAAAKFARYSNTRIVVADPALGRERISGVFDARDPVMFAKAMAVSLDLRAEVTADEVRIGR